MPLWVLLLTCTFRSSTTDVTLVYIVVGFQSFLFVPQYVRV